MGAADDHRLQYVGSHCCSGHGRCLGRVPMLLGRKLLQISGTNNHKQEIYRWLRRHWFSLSNSCRSLEDQDKQKARIWFTVHSPTRCRFILQSPSTPVHIPKPDMPRLEHCQGRQQHVPTLLCRYVQGISSSQSETHVSTFLSLTTGPIFEDGFPILRMHWGKHRC